MTQIALVGNPNAGKSTLFNALTGGNQHVGNWPGKTIERQTGQCQHQRHRLDLIDLPGTYSLTAYTQEEIVTRDYLLSGEPDGLIVVVDAANLERNLYLTAQVLELGLPSVVALNMIDAALGRGDTIDANALAAALSASVVPIVAKRRRGIDALLDSIVQTLAKEPVA